MAFNAGDIKGFVNEYKIDGGTIEYLLSKRILDL
jgi:hypothetical protein